MDPWNTNFILVLPTRNLSWKDAGSLEKICLSVPYPQLIRELQQELLAVRRQLESQATHILSLEAALFAHPELPPDAPETEKGELTADPQKTIWELEIVVCEYEDNLGEPLRQVREDVEREWKLSIYWSAGAAATVVVVDGDGDDLLDIAEGEPE
ncbi:hypothetical protein BS17DRAFT_818206 [Gyrodon lividus]|nr:hypothetical protein BS17DRAFT_818206 [Gyrodon lividus]